MEREWDWQVRVENGDQTNISKVSSAIKQGFIKLEEFRTCECTNTVPCIKHPRVW